MSRVISSLNKIPPRLITVCILIPVLIQRPQNLGPSPAISLSGLLVCQPKGLQQYKWWYHGRCGSTACRSSWKTNQKKQIDSGDLSIAAFDFSDFAGDSIHGFFNTYILFPHYEILVKSQYSPGMIYLYYVCIGKYVATELRIINHSEINQNPWIQSIQNITY